jgi:surface protein
MKIRFSTAVVVSLLSMSVAPMMAQAASAGGTCKTVDRTVVDSGVSLRCTQTNSGLKWRKFAPPVVASQPVVATTPVVVSPYVSVEATLLRQPGVISVNSNVVGTVYIAEVSVQVAKVSDIENAGGYLWVSAPITKVGVNEVSVDIDAIINGNYRVYVASDKGVLSAASLNMVVVSMPRLYDRPAAQDFVMTLDTTLSDDNTVVLPLGGTFNVTVNWGDGTSVETFTSDGDTEPSYFYENEGTYTIRISGALEHFGVVSDSSTWLGVNMVTIVTSFGTLGIESLKGAFISAENLIQVPTELPTSVTDTSSMFLYAFVFNQDLSSWDVTNVTNMRLMFAYAYVFNQDLSSWNVSNVTDMHGMFGEANAFNGDVSDWEVGNVTNMSYMFYRATVFNQDLNGWDTLSVTDMSHMFREASAFNQNIGRWNVSNVTNMRYTFYSASTFDQDLSSWVVGQVTEYGSMFTNSPMEEPDAHWPNFPT